jgi:hypothetical protein
MSCLLFIAHSCLVLLHRAPWWAPWYSVGPLVYQGAQCPPGGVVDTAQKWCRGT